MFELLFSLKTFTAAMLALYLSMVLGLDNPTWAMMCVYIIAQPFSGMALAKGVSRLLGTLFGACANQYSASDGRVVSLDHGCGGHSDVVAEQRAKELPAPAFDTIAIDESLFS